jgi:hypothetical protein
MLLRCLQNGLRCFLWHNAKSKCCIHSELRNKQWTSDSIMVIAGQQLSDRMAVARQQCFAGLSLSTFISLNNYHLIDQAVRPWLPTVVTWEWANVSSSGICGEQSDIEVGFLRVLRFPLPIILLTAPHSSSYIIQRCYKRQKGDSGTEHSVSPHPKSN